MRKAIAILTLAAIAASPASPVRQLAGRYSDGFVDPMSRQRLDNVIEIVPVDATHAYINLSLQFPNGFSCGLNGLAQARGQTLVYRDAVPDPGTGKSCVLTLRRDGADLSYDDGDSTCKNYCGMNGWLNGSIAWRSKRPIAYMARLKNSKAYRDAVATLRGK